MSVPFHTPYDGSSQPFALSLSSLELTHWIEVDDHLTAQLAQKDELFTTKHDLVFQAAGDTLPAQFEVLHLLMDYLPQRYPERYARAGRTITVGTQTYDPATYRDRPLELAARLVQDDLVLMRNVDGEHKLVAAALCFPSSWSLAEKFGHAMADIHGPVPGFGRGGRTAAMIERIFSNLKPGHPVERFNWSLYDAPDLYYPERSHAKAGLFAPDGSPNIWLRVERQTLRKLPESGDVLFTIKICVDPIATLQNHPDGPKLAASLHSQIEALNPAQIEYKGITEQVADVQAALEKLSAGDGASHS